MTQTTTAFPADLAQQRLAIEVAHLDHAAVAPSSRGAGRPTRRAAWRLAVSGRPGYWTAMELRHGRADQPHTANPQKTAAGPWTATSTTRAPRVTPTVRRRGGPAQVVAHACAGRGEPRPGTPPRGARSPRPPELDEQGSRCCRRAAPRCHADRATAKTATIRVRRCRAAVRLLSAPPARSRPAAGLRGHRRGRRQRPIAKRQDQSLELHAARG